MELKAKVNGIWVPVTFEQVQRMHEYELFALRSDYDAWRRETEAKTFSGSTPHDGDEP
jgi:hypothetical protein